MWKMDHWPVWSNPTNLGLFQSHLWLSTLPRFALHKFFSHFKRMDMECWIMGSCEHLKTAGSGRIGIFAWAGCHPSRYQGGKHTYHQRGRSSLSWLCANAVLRQQKRLMLFGYLCPQIRRVSELWLRGIMPGDFGFVLKQGLVKLADFGVATKLTEADVNTHSVVGTPYWMAPEVSIYFMLSVHFFGFLLTVSFPFEEARTYQWQLHLDGYVHGKNVGVAAHKLEWVCTSRW